MSAAVQAVQAVVSASPSLSPSPSLTPAVVHATVQATVQAHAAAAPAGGLNDLLNKLAALISPTDLVVLAGMVAAAVQSLLNRFPWLNHDVQEIQNARRFVVAVLLPLVGAYIASVASGVNDMGVAPWLFLVSQVAFRAVKLLLAAGQPSDIQLAATADGGPGSVEG